MSRITLNSNIAALQAERRLNGATRQLAQVYERLSSGLRINRASDDAAGLAIADTLRTESKLFSTATRNINDGLSALSISEGALEGQTGILHRLLELSEQSANGTFSDSQRATLQGEYTALVREFGRLGDTTSFNGLNLLRGNRSNGAGSLSLQAGIEGNSNSQLSINSIDTGTFSGTINASALKTPDWNGINGVSVQDLFDFLAADASSYTFDQLSSLFNHQLITTTYRDASGTEREFAFTFMRGTYSGGGTDVSNYALLTYYKQANGTYTAAGENAARFQTGSFTVDGAGQCNQTVTVTVNGTAVPIDIAGLRFQTSQTSVLEWSNVSTAARAKDALSIVRQRLSDLGQNKGAIGALQSRLQSALSLTLTAREVRSAAESQIRDADISVESSSLARLRILQQGAAAVLAQANQQPSITLQLLSALR